MKHRLVVGLCFGMAFGSVTSGQTVRTWVSGTGSDLNPCSRALPCRNFVAAIAAVDAGGEVVVLDSGGYGPVTIDKPVSVVAPPGVHAAIAPTAGPAITVATGGTVLLRNLFLNGRGGTRGISQFSDSNLFVEHCDISGFTEYGILFNPGPEAAYLSVSGCNIRNSIYGIGVARARAAFIGNSRLENHSEAAIWGAGPGQAQIAVRNTVVASSNYGYHLSADDGGTMNLIDSAAVACNIGFRVFSVLTANVNMNLEHCVASRNGMGLLATGNGTGVATMRVSNSAITNNAAGTNSGGAHTVRSRGNNTMENNDILNTFTSSYVAE